MIDKPFLFIDHGNVQHGRVGGQGDHALRYHDYLTPEGSDLEDAGAFVYGGSLQSRGRKTVIL